MTFLEIESLAPGKWKEIFPFEKNSPVYPDYAQAPAVYVETVKTFPV